MTVKADRGVGEACTPQHHKFARGHKPGDVCRCGATKRCNQCSVPRLVADFGTRLKNCNFCAAKWGARRRGERVVEARRGLPTSGEARYTWVERSGNAKLGPIPTCISSAESCPPSCSWYGNGCFAEVDVLAHHWRNTQPGKRGITFDELLLRICGLKPGQVWRYATAGDLPGVGEEIDLDKLQQLVHANIGRRGFGFTHKRPVNLAAAALIREANRSGFTLNLSADSLRQADELAAMAVAPVAVVVPTDAPANLRTPGGRRLVFCPAETRGLTCERCQLCTRADRRGIVAFRAHGQLKKAVSRLAVLQ